MFQSSMQEANSNEVQINDTSYEAYYCTLQWIYTGDFHSEDTQLLLDVWQISHMLNLRDLHRLVQNKIIAHLKQYPEIDGTTSLFKFIKTLFEEAYLKNSRYLVRFCSSFLLENLGQFLGDKSCFQESNIKEKYVQWLFETVDCQQNDEFRTYILSLPVDNQELTKSIVETIQPKPPSKSVTLEKVWSMPIQVISFAIQSVSNYLGFTKEEQPQLNEPDVQIQQSNIHEDGIEFEVLGITKN